MSVFSSLDIAGSALTAERIRTDVILQNIANAETTKTENGEPYRRQQVMMQAIPLSFEQELKKADSGTDNQKTSGGVKITMVVESDREFS